MANLGAARHDHGVLDRVFEFADVAGEGIALQRAPHRRRNTGCHTCGRVAVQKMSHKCGEILHALPQRRLRATPPP